MFSSWPPESNRLLAALIAIEPEKVYAMPDPALAALADDEFKFMAILAELADRELVATIGWAKQVPGKAYCIDLIK